MSKSGPDSNTTETGCSSKEAPRYQHHINPHKRAHKKEKNQF